MQAKVELKEEALKAHRLERVADQVAMKDLGLYRGGIIMLPKYKFEKEPFSLYVEIDVPPESIFMRIGYNGQTTIKKLVSEQTAEPAQTEAQDDFCKALTE